LKQAFAKPESLNYSNGLLMAVITVSTYVLAIFGLQSQQDLRFGRWIKMSDKYCIADYFI
jgi:hypothetical protein